MSTNIRMAANTDDKPKIEISPRRKWRFLFVALFIALFTGASYIFSALYMPTPRFPIGAYVTISAGATLNTAADILESRGIIRSSFFFREYVRFFEGGRYVVAGQYYFDARIGAVDVAKRMIAGDYNIPRLKILVPEGSDVMEIAASIKAQISGFESKKFAVLALPEEGYLFPDTYFFFGNVTPEEVVRSMKENFQMRTKDVAEKVAASKRTWHEILTMASIIERETKTAESRRIVSGILWKRIKIGMPLQVDATFSYVNGKTTYELTQADLDIDSKYNTYEYKGLPPGPICNPGIDSIVATLEPTKTDYLYYLSEKDGTMHYAKTFDEHKVNKYKYMR